MADGNVGLSFEITADPAAAVAGLDRLATSAEVATARLQAGFGQSDTALLNSRESVRLLAEGFGIHMPRGIVTAISNVGALKDVMASAAEIGIALFAVEAAVRFAKAVKGAIDEMNGLKAAQEQYTEAVKASNEALLHLNTAQMGQQRLVALNQQIVAQEALVEQTKKEGEYWVQNYGLIGTGIAKITGQVGEQTKAEKDLNALYGLRMKLLQEVGKVAEEGHKKAAEAAQVHVKALHEMALVLPPIVAAMMQIEKSQADKAIRAQAEALLDFRKNLQPLLLDLPTFKETTDALGQSYQKIPGYIDPATISIGLLQRAYNLLDDAQMASTVLQGAALLQGIGMRRAAAAVETVWATAQGFEALASLNFWSAAQWFMSAAQHGIVAGSGAAGGSPGVAAAAAVPPSRAAYVQPAPVVSQLGAQAGPAPGPGADAYSAAGQPIQVHVHITQQSDIPTLIKKINVAVLRNNQPLAATVVTRPVVALI